MKSRLAALGGCHRIVLLAVVATCLAAAPLQSAHPATAGPAAGPPGGSAQISTPMTGLLPACPAELKDFVSHDVWVEDDISSNFSTHSEAGLDQNCAWQNMQDRTNTSLWPRAVNARAVPDTVPINDDPTTISFVVDGLAAPGPFNTAIADCMPLSTRPGGCSSDPNPAIYVAYRKANGAGQFVGRWTQVIEPSDNPYFDLTRDQNGCDDNYANWTPNYPHTGLPCEFELNFATSAGGAPVLTTAMQVIVAVDWLYGTTSNQSGTNVGYSYSYEAVVPMLFTPGSSTSLSLDSLPGTVPYGTALSLRSTAVGPPPGSQVNFYRRGSNGTSAFVGQALTDAGGVATLPTTATGNAEYWSRLVSGGTETAQSQTRTLGVTRGVALAVKKRGKKKVQLTATLTPGSGAGSVLLQRKDKKKGWVTVKSATPAPSVAWTLKPPKGKSWWRVLLPTGSDFRESVSVEVKVKGKT